jgi:hypothetical protein
MAKSTFDYPQSSALVGRMLLAVYKPLARILIRLRVPYSQAAELLKWVMVHEHAACMAARNSSVSELALQTGLCRKEVKKLLEAEAPIGREYPRRHERIPAIIHGWLNDPRFADQPGGPCTLKLQGGEGSFQDLASHYGADIPYAVIVRELLDAGTASMPTPKSIKLDVDMMGESLPLAPGQAIFGCVMHLQNRWNELCEMNGNVPAIRLRGPAPSLEAFVNDFSSNVSVDLVIHELVRGGCIAVDGELVRMTKPTYIPLNSTVLFEIACENIGNFVSTIDHNLTAQQPEHRLLQSELSFYGLVASDREAFEAAVRKEVEALKKRLNEKFNARQFREVGVPAVGIGTYLVRMPDGRRGFGSFETRELAVESLES